MAKIKLTKSSEIQSHYSRRICFTIPEDRKEVIEKLRCAILENLPEGFEEGINYGMIGYFVPHSIYPDGYHCTPELPLPFMSVASQKYSVNIYHSGLLGLTLL